MRKRCQLPIVAFRLLYADPPSLRDDILSSLDLGLGLELTEWSGRRHTLSVGGHAKMSYKPAVEAPRIKIAPLHRRGYYQVRPGDILGRSDLLLLDVRRTEDLDRDPGHIAGVQNLPLADLESFSSPPDAPLVVICGNGRESVRAAEQLAKRGYKEVYHLVGGMLRWTAEEKPTANRVSWRPYSP